MGHFSIHTCSAMFPTTICNGSPALCPSAVYRPCISKRIGPTSLLARPRSSSVYRANAQPQHVADPTLGCDTPHAHLYAHPSAVTEEEVVAGATNERGDLKAREAPAQSQAARPQEMLARHQERGTVEPEPYKVDEREHPVPGVVPEVRHDVDVIIPEAPQDQHPLPWHAWTIPRVRVLVAPDPSDGATRLPRWAPLDAYFGASAELFALMFFVHRHGRLRVARVREGPPGPPGSGEGRTMLSRQEGFDRP